MTAFYNNGYMCIVDKDPNELPDHFIIRGEFIAKCKPSNEQEYATCVTYSRIYINVLLKKCTYSKEIMDKLSCIK
jgi:hypothetical protein